MTTIRTTQQRIADVKAALESQRDLWLATANKSGPPHLIPLSFLWDGVDVILSTPRPSRTVRNLAGNPLARIALGADLEDVIVMDATATIVNTDEIDPGLAEDFAAKAEFEPRHLDGDYVYVRLVPSRVLAWRSESELNGRTLMTDGNWIVD